jgi:hypothetical protein
MVLHRSSGTVIRRRFAREQTMRRLIHCIAAMARSDDQLTMTVLSFAGENDVIGRVASPANPYPC